MKLILSSHNSDKGFTLVELLVAMSLAMMMGGMLLSTTLLSKRTFNFDMRRIKLDQNLRGAMDILGSDIRVGGENLSAVFPAFEIVDNGGTWGDELIVRRSLLDEVLPVCQDIVSGSSVAEVYFAVGGATSAACVYSGQTHNFNAWRTYRTSATSTVRAFLYDVNSKKGEFFDYVNDGTTGTAYYIVRGSGTWANSYTAVSTSIYIIEEWRFKLNGDVMTLQQDGLTEVKNIASDLNDFQVTAYFSDGTIHPSLARTDDWTQIQALEIYVAASDTFDRSPITRSLRSRFFPRNILSQ